MPNLKATQRFIAITLNMEWIEIAKMWQNNIYLDGSCICKNSGLVLQIKKNKFLSFQQENRKKWAKDPIYPKFKKHKNHKPSKFNRYTVSMPFTTLVYGSDPLYNKNTTEKNWRRERE